MNFRLARNAVYKYPIFAHVDNAYANIPLTKPPTDVKQRLSANGYRSPNQMGNCPLLCCKQAMPSGMQRRLSSYAGASQQLRKGALAAMQRRDSSPLELDFLIQNRCYYVSELVFVDFLGLD